MIIYAPGIHTGGGYVLLRELLTSLPTCKVDLLYLDIRVRSRVFDLIDEDRVLWINPSFKGRVLAEFYLFSHRRYNGTILLFSNLPPLFFSSKSSVLFLQNRLLVLKQYVPGSSFKARVRLFIDRTILSLRRNAVGSIVVQTRSMKSDLNKFFDRKSFPTRSPSITVLGFSKQCLDARYSEISGLNDLKFDFCYPSDGQPHKNHLVLFEALSELAQMGIFPKIAVTLDDSQTRVLSLLSAYKSNFKIEVVNVGVLDRDSVLDLYTQSAALIFPSLVESFGLPLLEAKSLGIPIIASELDYVRDVCSPIETFNPHSSRSVALAIMRFLGHEPEYTAIVGGEEFVRRIER